MNKNSFLLLLLFLLFLLLLLEYILKWQYRAGNGAEAGAKIRREKKEPETKINNFGSATLAQTHFLDNNNNNKIMVYNSQLIFR